MGIYNQTTPPAPTISGTLLPASNSLVAKASRFAIAVDDLLYMNGQGYVFPAQSTAWASTAATGGNSGSALVAETSISASTTATTADVQQAVFVSPADQSVYVLAADTNSVAVLSKFSPTGVLLASIALETVTLAQSDARGGYNIIQLSNGNLAVLWSYHRSTPVTSCNFAVVDADLNVVVTKTAITGPSYSNVVTPTIHAVALSGGGFAVCICSPGVGSGAYFAIFGNNGSVVRASAIITGTAALTQCGTRCIQMSNGDVMVAITSNVAGNGLAIASFTAAGAAGIAYTVIDAGAGVNGLPEISAIAGYVAIGAFIGAASTPKVYVLNNAGAAQGLALTPTVSNSRVPLIRQDGTYFWVFYISTGPIYTAVRLPITGAASAVSSTMNGPTENFIDMFIERDMVVIAQGNKIMAFGLRADGTTTLLSSATAPTTLPSAPQLNMKPSGDFSAVVYTSADGTNAAKFRVWRYLDVAIIGVSKTAVTAGNANALVTISVGPSAMKINALPGPAARLFDNSGGTLVGNKGYLLQNSVSLKGY